MMRILLLCFSIIFIVFNSFGQNKIDSIAYSSDVNWNLILASYHNDSSKIFYWLDKGADVNFETGDGITPLMYAAENNSLYSVQLLVANGAEIDKIPFLGSPALTTACLNNNFDIAEYLIRKGADINIVDQFGNTPLIQMCLYQNFYMADMLIYYDAKIDKVDENRNTPLIYALKNSDDDLVDLLLKNNANIDKSDIKGNTPLILACQQNDTSILKLLIKNGAGVTVPNYDGYDAISYAIKNKNYEIASILIDAGAKVNTIYNNKLNTATLSMIYGTREITNLIKQNGGEVNYAPQFKNFAIAVDIPFNNGDYFLGTNFSFIDKKYNLSIESGFLFRPSAIRTLNRIDDYNFYQFWERRYILYTGLKQSQKLAMVRESSFNIDYGINLGFTWGGFVGSDSNPKSKFILVPNASLYYHYNFLETGIGYEFMELNILKKSPHMINFFIRFLIPNKFELH
jgi:ankyrin repeat protein